MVTGRQAQRSATSSSGSISSLVSPIEVGLVDWQAGQQNNYSYTRDRGLTLARAPISGLDEQDHNLCTLCISRGLFWERPEAIRKQVVLPVTAPGR